MFTAAYTMLALSAYPEKLIQYVDDHLGPLSAPTARRLYGREGILLIMDLLATFASPEGLHKVSSWDADRFTQLQAQLKAKKAGPLGVEAIFQLVRQTQLRGQMHSLTLDARKHLNEILPSQRFHAY